jgi:hypothetical protein
MRERWALWSRLHPGEISEISSNSSISSPPFVKISPFSPGFEGNGDKSDENEKAIIRHRALSLTMKGHINVTFQV